VLPGGSTRNVAFAETTQAYNCTDLAPTVERRGGRHLEADRH